MARRRRKQQSQRWVTILLVVFAVLLLGAIGAGTWMLIQMFQSDVTAESVTVPDLSGMTKAQADEALKALRLVPREARADHHESVPEGQVFRQDPEAGQEVRPNRQVRYYLSLGKATFTVPNLVGESLDSAAKVLGRGGMRLGNIKRIYTRLRPSGRIMNQSPAAGQQFAQPIAVDVVVADNTFAPKVTMPDLAGLQLGVAEELLTRPDLNLQLALVEYVANDIVSPGTVVTQNPAAGAEAEMGSRVQLQIGVPTLLKAMPTKQLFMRIRIPDGPEDQLVKIKVNDALGEKVDYSETHDPGEIVERTVDVEGDATVRVFLIDEKTPWREERL